MKKYKILGYSYYSSSAQLSVLYYTALYKYKSTPHKHTTQDLNIMFFYYVCLQHVKSTTLLTDACCICSQVGM